MIRLFVFTASVLVLATTSEAQDRPPIAEQMAKTYGLDSFSQIEKLRYTFNIDAPGVQVARTWEWEPKIDQVSYEGKDKDAKPMKVTYQRSQLSSQSDAVKNEVDPAFINDQYWLLFPLHVSWDGSATVSHEGLHKLPMGNGSAERVIVKYPRTAATHPAILGNSTSVQTIAFYHGGGPGTQKRPSLLIATWADYKKAGPLLISTDHRGTADGKPLRVFFSDVSVKVTGSDSWINAQ
jgi:hypothetical protein